MKRLQVTVARLRKTLDVTSQRRIAAANHRGRLLLTVAPGELDADVFETRFDDGRRALENGEPRRSGERPRDALAMWRGPPLAEVAYQPFAQAQVRRLEVLRLAALKVRVEADLRMGRQTAVTEGLEALLAAHPTRERLAS